MTIYFVLILINYSNSKKKSVIYFLINNNKNYYFLFIFYKKIIFKLKNFNLLINYIFCLIHKIIILLTVSFKYFKSFMTVTCSSCQANCFNGVTNSNRQRTNWVLFHNLLLINNNNNNIFKWIIKLLARVVFIFTKNWI